MIGRVLLGLQKAGSRRGLRGTSRAWTVVWVLAFAARQLHKRSGRRGEAVVFREELRPGEAFVVTHTRETHRETHG